jgi:hypothetical protein
MRASAAYMGDAVHMLNVCTWYLLPHSPFPYALYTHRRAPRTRPVFWTERLLRYLRYLTCLKENRIKWVREAALRWK